MDSQRNSECHWANVVSNQSSSASAENCDMPCPGGDHKLEICGGKKYISMYEDRNVTAPAVVLRAGDFADPRCVYDKQHGSVLLSGGTSSPLMTVEKCFDLAYSYRYAGVEDGQ